MRGRAGNRRGQTRFEIVGNLWGSVETTVPLVLKNVGFGGALVEGPMPLAPDSVHSAVASEGGEAHHMRIRIRHLRPTSVGSYLIGVEFLTHNPAIEGFVERHSGRPGAGRAGGES